MSQIDLDISSADPQIVDTLISARWIIPIRPAKKILENHAIAIKNGIIISIIPTDVADHQFQATNRIDLPHHLLSPGLINAHGHAAMSLFRGMADDTPLQEWLQDYIWPAEERWVGEEFVRDGTQLAMAEMLRSGTTTFSDMYFFPNITAREADQAGMRAQVAFPVFDFPSIWGQDPDDYIHKGLKVRDDFKHNGRIECVFGPHATYTISDEPLKRIAVLAAELDIGIHMHVHENAKEIADELERSGCRPIHRLHKLEILTPKTQLVHMTTLNDDDINQVKESGAHIIHCPTSNLKLASGMSPIHSLMNEGINIALGTDSAASNNCLDLFSEMRIAALLAKAVSSDASALTDWQALEAATLGGARALAIDNKVGSLEIGKHADIIAIDFSQLEQQPLHQPIAQLVYTPCGHLVTHSWVDGKQLMSDRQLLTIDEHAIKNKTRSWQNKIMSSIS
jgi:5-methylthioadenosine/S-adenosylhomocysteine deaminase